MGGCSAIGGWLRPYESKAEVSVLLLHFTPSTPKKESTDCDDLQGIFGVYVSECVFECAHVCIGCRGQILLHFLTP